MSTSTPTVTFKGDPLHLEGHPVRVGEKAPDFVVTGSDMSDVSSQSFKGKTVVISSVPSLDTPVCSMQTKRLNNELGALPGVVVLTISMDLPFAQKRWCGAEGADKVVVASDFKYRSFGEAMGLRLREWGLLARAAFVVDQTGTVTYVDVVPEISQEPNYDALVSAVKKALG